MPETSRTCPWKCRGWRGRWRGGAEAQGPTKLKGATGELWVGLLASMNCVRGLCNARTCRSRSWGRNAIQRSLGELRVLSHQVLDDALNNIALTSQCKGDLKNPPMEVSGAARKAGRGREKTRDGRGDR